MGKTRGLRPLLVVCLTLLLLRCDLMSSSAFPSYLPLLEKSREMADYVGDRDSTWVNLQVLPFGSTDRLFLTVWRSGAPGRLLIMDEGLQILADYTDEGLRTTLGATSGNLGRTVMIDANGDYVVGNFVFDDVTLAPLLSTSQLVAGTSGDVAGVSHIPGFANYLIWVDNSSIPSLLRVDQRAASWGTPTSFAPQLAVEAWQLSLERVVRTYTAPETYYFVFGTYNNVIILTLPSADFEGGSPVQPLIPTPPTINYPWFGIPNARADSVQFTVDGFVVRTDRGERQLWGDGGLKDTYQPAESEGEMDEAYSPFAKHYYALDRATGKLLRLSVWW